MIFTKNNNTSVHSAEFTIMFITSWNVLSEEDKKLLYLTHENILRQKIIQGNECIFPAINRSSHIEIYNDK